LLRQFEAYHGERARVHPFYDWDSALKWLDVRDVSSRLLVDETDTRQRDAA